MTHALAMLIPFRTQISDALRIRAALRRRPISPRQRLIWTLGNLLMFTGIYLLFYVGGVYVQIDYQRLAARGDNDLDVPRAMISASAFLTGHSRLRLPGSLRSSMPHLWHRRPSVCPSLESVSYTHLTLPTNREV